MNCYVLREAVASLRAKTGNRDVPAHAFKKPVTNLLSRFHSSTLPLNQDVGTGTVYRSRRMFLCFQSTYLDSTDTLQTMPGKDNYESLNRDEKEQAVYDDKKKVKDIRAERKRIKEAIHQHQADGTNTVLAKIQDSADFGKLKELYKLYMLSQTLKVSTAKHCLQYTS
jgi:hypothetical protein